MAVYIFNLLVGYIRGGIDHAQGYRAQALRDLSQPVKFIFTEVPTRRDIDYYEHVGISVEQMLSAHQFFTGNQNLEVSVSTEKKLEELRDVLHYTDVQYWDTEVRLIKDGCVIASLLLQGRRDQFYGIHYYDDKVRLIRTEYYTNRIFYADYYVTAEGDNGLYAERVRREFYNADGSIVYEEIWEEEREWYLFSDGERCTKAQFVAKFIKKLDLSQRDIVFMDRLTESDFVQQIFQFGGDARIMTFFHSGHYFEKWEDPQLYYLNYEYFFWIKYAHRIDTMVVSTQEQKEELIEKLREYKCAVPNIEVIPVSGLSKLRYLRGGRKPYSLVSASRINPKKKIEWIVRSVVKAHEKNSNVSIDIYGGQEISYFRYVQGIVTANDAWSYIHFKGYMDITEIYKEYEVYLSSSLGETLGLSLMEAVGSGTAMIGLDVKYGNRQFIQPGKNGYLIPYDRKYIEEDDSELIDAMAEKIVEIFEDQDRLERFHQASYEIAKDFADEIIGEKWRKLFS